MYVLEGYFYLYKVIIILIYSPLNVTFVPFITFVSSQTVLNNLHLEAEQGNL